MRQATHTPGPWRVAASSTGMIDRCVVSNGGDQIATVNTTNNTQANRAANARLIASAPELLEACQLALEKLQAMKERFGSKWPLDLSPTRAETALLAAIHHATGRQAGKG